jgi:transglutaminase-like putative cysteine protease
MWLYTACILHFEINTPTPFILMLRPRRDVQQWVTREEYVLEPSVELLEYTDGFGNSCQRLTAPVGEFSIRSSAFTMTSENIDVSYGAPFIEIQNLPDNTIPYLLPSRYCESDRFGLLAMEITHDVEDGYNQVATILEWVRSMVEYAPGSSSVSLSAIEVKEQRYGVCRDLAHLCIALCRSLSIPARMVVGYLDKLQPMDLHAWFEAYVGDRWYTFDPTLSAPRGGRVIVAYGRDASDVAVYTKFGPPVNFSSMDVTVNVLDGPPA